MMTETHPISQQLFGPGDQTRLVLVPAWTDPVTGALYVHKDMECEREDWAREKHIPPPAGTLAFGDVESWAYYVLRYGGGERTLLTWNAGGLHATLDHHHTMSSPGRCQWRAVHPFVLAREMEAWRKLANGGAVAQKAAIEELEDLGDDIIEPSPADLMLILRSLRANATAKAEATLHEDGTAAVSFAKETSVASNKTGSVALPPVIRIAIPVLAGDNAKFELKVRMRISVDDNAHLTFRFTLVNAERVLETVYAERVAQAKTLLGERFELLRAG